ncbi:alpha/beta hydrolase [Bradyrhizobium australiense]|uniref:Alpha/beta hydrolase n=1 Tax=Bradyrhizobium australiense TaxID=2721161 RepID=A0A7Y4GUJ6_9BRAD|nr:alpha/beta hydrolase [Bradyrhizobium australiense]NOJ41888.1 alpha/beta hydrolase [Bradyrhizobium australiense]
MSLRAELLRIGIRMLLKRRGGSLDVEQWRRNMRAMERFVPHPPSRSATVEIEAGRVRFHRVTTPASRPERNVLYLHGGAYVSGAPIYYRHFLWRIADALQARVWALEYRLAPEHAFPAALEDAVEGYRCLAHHAADIRQLFVVGDSAGGGLALGLLLRLRDDGKPLPAAAVALSPWTDLALTGASLRTNAAADPMLNVEDLPDLAKLYLAGADPRTPHASPLYGDPAGLPPVLIQVGSDEILRDDAVRMAEKLRSHNPRSRIEIWRRMPHAWQLFVPVLPESHQAIAQIGAFVSEMQR